MKKNPLADPEPESPALAAFVKHFRLQPATPGEALVENVATAFSAIPYENLTKVLRQDQAGGGAARRGPEEVIGEHIRQVTCCGRSGCGPNRSSPTATTETIPTAPCWSGCMESRTCWIPAT